MSALKSAYRKWVIEQPVPVLILLLLVSGFFASQVKHFRLDASADSLLLDNDADLRYYQKAKRLFSTDSGEEADEYLLLAYEPQGDLFSDETLSHLRALTTDLEKVEGVTAVRSILDVPLFHSPKLNLMQIAASAMSGGLPTLERETTDRELARKELTESPYASDLIISKEGDITALIVILEKDADFTAMGREREDLKAKKYESGLNAVEEATLADLEVRYRTAKELVDATQAERVAAVRAVIEQNTGQATMFLGGVPMVVADMISFVRSDLVTFGVGVMVFLVLTLGVIFRRPRWVILPLLTCVMTVLIMVGFLGFMEWPATVISSNFTSLLFIITMSMAIHIVVRYRELNGRRPEATHHDLVFDAVCLVARPCFYCTLTTMVGFGSLIISGIQPVIDFGRMMTLGIFVAYIVCFTFFPAALALLKKTKSAAVAETGRPISLYFADITLGRGRILAFAALTLVALGGIGITRLTVENRFVDYFKANTEINKGMVIVDSRLSGTTPMEIVLSGEGNDYWFKPENLTKLRKLHQFLESQSEVGKVLSLDTLIQVGEGINNDQPLNPMIMGMVRRMLPADMKEQLMRPFATEDFTQARLVALVRETDENLRRDVLLGKIQNFLDEEGYGKDEARVTGLYVLYNNLLQSLFRSQILTIGFVFAAVWLMFALLFRSVYLATIALVPNVFPVVLVLGALGLMGIPLDIMTITISAITIGIAVDQTIHYVHRFKEEFPRVGNYGETMKLCHGSIGRAMYYTSVTIIAGFSILALSNFMPTIYFGLFTSLAMLAALFGSLTLLPGLIVWLKPLGPEQKHQEG